MTIYSLKTLEEGLSFFQPSPDQWLLVDIEGTLVPSVFPIFKETSPDSSQPEELMLLDPLWTKVFNQLQQGQQSVFGLTKLPTGAYGSTSSIEMTCVKALRDLGLNFSCVHESQEQPQTIYQPGPALLPATHFQGVLFSGDSRKSQAFSGFLETYQLQAPEKIIFVDDKYPHLEDLEIFCEGKGIEFLGLHLQLIYNF